MEKQVIQGNENIQIHGNVTINIDVIELLKILLEDRDLILSLIQKLGV